MRKLLLLLCCWFSVIGLSAQTSDDGNSGKYYVYFDNTENWTPYVWAWNDTDNNCTNAEKYPGEPMTQKDGKYYWDNTSVIF